MSCPFAFSSVDEYKRAIEVFLLKLEREISKIENKPSRDINKNGPFYIDFTERHLIKTLSEILNIEPAYVLTGKEGDSFKVYPGKLTGFLENISKILMILNQS